MPNGWIIRKPVAELISTKQESRDEMTATGKAYPEGTGSLLCDQSKYSLK